MIERLKLSYSLAIYWLCDLGQAILLLMRQFHIYKMAIVIPTSQNIGEYQRDNVGYKTYYNALYKQ